MDHQITQIGTTKKGKPILDSQHCTDPDCPTKGMSHTAAWCGRPQPRRCKCGYCYPES
jgi:hypothetical protein